jgi:hypothetical protein
MPKTCGTVAEDSGVLRSARADRESMIRAMMKRVRRAIRLAARFSFDLLTNPF